MGGKGPHHLGPGQVKQSGSTLIFGPSYSASRRAEHFFLKLSRSSLVQSVFFLDNAPQPPLGSCSSAPKICSLKPWQARIHGAEGRMPLVSGSEELVG